MAPGEPDSTRRFSDRVAAYVRSRPSYPPEVLAILREQTGLTADAVIADVGSGTGVSAELLLQNGNVVFAIEPNAAMREAAEARLSHNPNFRSVQGTAEATTLPAAVVDYIVAAQAFHWFNLREAKREFQRILRPPGWVVLLWNTRLIDTTPFLQAYESLLLNHGTDYRAVRHTNVDHAALGDFFAEGTYEKRTRAHAQQFDREGLRQRLLSSSYVPAAGERGHDAMLNALDRLFDEHQSHGTVRMAYTTEVHFGCVR